MAVDVLAQIGNRGTNVMSNSAEYAEGTVLIGFKPKVTRFCRQHQQVAETGRSEALGNALGHRCARDDGGQLAMELVSGIGGVKQACHGPSGLVGGPFLAVAGKIVKRFDVRK